MKKRKLVFLIVRWLVGIALLGFLLLQLRSSVILEHFAEIRWSLIGAAAFALATGFAIGARGQHLLVYPIFQVSYWRWLKVFWVAWAVGLFLPGQVGDIASLTLWLKKQGVEFGSGVSRLILDKIISLLVIMLWGGVAASVFLFPERWWLVALGVTLVCVFVICCVVLMAKGAHFELSRKLFPRLGIEREMVELRLVCGNVVLTFLKSLVTGLAYWLVFRAVGFDDVGYWMALTLTALVSLVAYVPISVNGLGVVEIGAIYLFAQVGVPQSEVFTAFLVLRSLVWVVVLVPAGLLLLKTDD